ncbi:MULTISPECIES: nuclear transport factor 2 family protein [unclassified Brevundimonas]|uniref:nuclear transport factor 2 family protein n=1 Tax=unclassified Brevundimonas TaxID=2622653 RepID=UPI0025BE38E3|nr:MULTISPECIES: nuclear transport factor 2 family protein [unclassified Brevundimonas]
MITAALMMLQVSAAPLQAVAAVEAETASVERTLDAMHAAASKADGEAYFATFTTDGRFIGTDATERWTLPEFRAYAMPYFSQGKGWTYRPVTRTVTIAAIDCRCVAWFDEVLDNDAYGTTRGSGVLRLTDDGWKIEQYVLSFPVPNDKARAVVGVIKAD